MTSPTARYGTHSTGDIIDSQVLISKTVDGVDLGSLWDEFTDLLDIYNAHTTKLADLLRFPVTIAGSAVPQGISSPEFELSTEYGAPMAAGPPVDAAVLGYRFDHYDLRSSFSWQYLSRATADEVRAVMNSIIASDLKLINGLTLRRLFDNRVEHNRESFACRGLWTGDDQQTPPPFLGTEFPSSTSHYVASQATVIDSDDVETCVALVRSKGYGLQGKSRLLLLCNAQESKAVQTWRNGVPSRSSGPTANHDWVPATSAPPHYSEDILVGTPVSGELYGLDALGSYGYCTLIESSYVPAGYFAVVATGGPQSPANVIGFRESPDPAQRGLRQIPGADWTPYPIVGSYHVRSCGVGTRQRGGAAVCQITSGSVYTPPATIPAFRR